MPATEIRDVIDRLSTADRHRLLKTAEWRCYGTGLDADDLFQEAIKRSLEGGRRCPCDVEPVVFLAGVICSVADAERKKRSRERTVRQEKQVETLGASNVTGVRAEFVAPELEAECKRMVEALFDLFEGDEEAELVLMGQLEGLSAQDIRVMNGMDKTALATVRRRMNRKIKIAFPKGWTR